MNWGGAPESRQIGLRPRITGYRVLTLWIGRLYGASIEPVARSRWAVSPSASIRFKSGRQGWFKSATRDLLAGS